MIILSCLINFILYYSPDELAILQMKLDQFQTSWGKIQPTILIAYLSLLYFPDELGPFQMSWSCCRRAG